MDARFDVWLLGFEDGVGDPAPSLVRVFGIDDAQARVIAAACPRVVRHGASHEDASAMALALERIGADVELRRVGSVIPGFVPGGTGVARIGPESLPPVLRMPSAPPVSSAPPPRTSPPPPRPPSVPPVAPARPSRPPAAATSSPPAAPLASYPPAAATTGMRSLAPAMPQPMSDAVRARLDADATAESTGGWPGAGALLVIGGGIIITRLALGHSVFLGTAWWGFGAWVDGTCLAMVILGAIHSVRLLGWADLGVTWKAVLPSAYSVCILSNYGVAIHRYNDELDRSDVQDRLEDAREVAEDCLDSSMEECNQCCDDGHVIATWDGTCRCMVPTACPEGDADRDACGICCDEADPDRGFRAQAFEPELGCYCNTTELFSRY